MAGLVNVDDRAAAGRPPSLALDPALLPLGLLLPLLLLHPPAGATSPHQLNGSEQRDSPAAAAVVPQPGQQSSGEILASPSAGCGKAMYFMLPLYRRLEQRPAVGASGNDTQDAALSEDGGESVPLTEERRQWRDAMKTHLAAVGTVMPSRGIKVS
jgi:hypothetical protein